MAYIDSEIAKRRLRSSSRPQTAPSTPPSHPTSVIDPLQQKLETEKETQRQPASLGRLQEVDLGDDVRDMNVAQTERARRIQAGEEVEESVKKVPKVRLGPDGKPWRGRKRRGSDDVKRDRLVEDVLRESRRGFSLSLLPESS